MRAISMPRELQAQAQAILNEFAGGAVEPGQYPDADIIVVLGTHTTRALKAAFSYAKNNVGNPVKWVFAGGKGYGTIPLIREVHQDYPALAGCIETLQEAGIYKLIALIANKEGVEYKDILFDKLSTTTIENFKNTVELIRKQRDSMNLKRDMKIVVFTADTQQLRAREDATKHYESLGKVEVRIINTGVTDLSRATDYQLALTLWRLFGDGRGTETDPHGERDIFQKFYCESADPPIPHVILLTDVMAYWPRVFEWYQEHILHIIRLTTPDW